MNKRQKEAIKLLDSEMQKSWSHGFNVESLVGFQYVMIPYVKELEAILEDYYNAGGEYDGFKAADYSDFSGCASMMDYVSDRWGSYPRLCCVIGFIKAKDWTV